MLHPEAIVVIYIRLEGLDYEGDPSYLVFNAIKPFYPTTICQATYINLVYNIPNDDGGAGMTRYAQDIDQAVAKLSKYVIPLFMCLRASH